MSFLSSTITMNKRTRTPLPILLALTLTFLFTASAQSGPNRISVKSFGAVGDGKHDDTAAIMAAASELLVGVAPGQDNQLYFPSGRYLLGSVPSSNGGYLSFTPQVNVTFTILGAGSASTELLWQPQNGILFTPGSSNVYNTVSGSAFEIRDLTVSWFASFQQNEQNMLHLAYYEKIVVSDCDFLGTVAQGQGGFDEQITLLNINGDGSIPTTLLVSNVITNGSSTFISVFDVNASVNNTQISNTVTGVIIQNTGGNLQIDAMTQTNVPFGIYIQGEYVNVQVTNSEFIMPPGSKFIPNEAICQSATGELYVEKCTFTDPTGQRVHIDASTGSTTIVNNVFNGGSAAYYPLGFVQESGPMYDGCYSPQSVEVNITGNTFNGPFKASPLMPISNMVLETNATTSTYINDNTCTGSVGMQQFTCAAGTPCQQQNNDGCTLITPPPVAPPVQPNDTMSQSIESL